MSYFNHWLTDEELEDSVIFFDDTNAESGVNNDFYYDYFIFENKVINFLIDRYNNNVFLFSSHINFSSIYSFSDKEDLSCITKLILRKDLMPIYIRSYRTVFCAQTDLTWGAITSDDFRTIDIQKHIKEYEINILI